MRLNEYAKEIQSLPLNKRRIIFWTILIIFGITIFIFWLKNAKQSIETFPKGEFLQKMNVPELEKDIRNLPKPELPNLKIEENLKKLEETKENTK